MTTYANALSHILENIEALPAREQPLAACFGQAAAEDIYSSLTLPAMPTGGPDGYAARSADLKSATRENPVTLRIQETVRAGRMPKRRVEQGFAARTMTGATVPEGADCVVRFEDTDEPAGKNGPNPAEPTEVMIYVSPKPGENILPAGHIVRTGALALAKGTVIGAGQISALTAIGVRRIQVARRPTVAILCTGDELVARGGRLQAGKIYNSNGPALAALTARHGGTPKLMGIARDNLASLEKKFTQCMQADLIFTSGGVSKGDFDLVRLVIGKYGKVLFSRIQMGPGASFSFGVISASNGRQAPVFALAGPPSGCLINYLTLARPALRKMLGYSSLFPPTVKAVAVDEAINKAPFPFVRYGQLERGEQHCQVRFGKSTGPGGLASLAACNSLVILDQGSSVKPGDWVEALPFD